MPELPQRHRHLPLHRYRGEHRALGAGPRRRWRLPSNATWPFSDAAIAAPWQRPLQDRWRCCAGGLCTAPAALAAAVDGQRALLAEPWPEEIGSLRVRMALHAGTAEPVAGDYLAPALNRLSRMLGAGHGGQILVSDASGASSRTISHRGDAAPRSASTRCAICRRRKRSSRSLRRDCRIASRTCAHCRTIRRICVAAHAAHRSRPGARDGDAHVPGRGCAAGDADRPRRQRQDPAGAGDRRRAPR